MISLLPARVIKLLEFIGFSGNKQMGLQDLMTGSKMTGLRQVLCVLTLLGYHLIVCYVLSHQEGDLELCNEMLEQQLSVSTLRVIEIDEIRAIYRNDILMTKPSAHSCTRTESGSCFSRGGSSSCAATWTRPWCGTKSRGGRRTCGLNFTTSVFGKFCGLTASSLIGARRFCSRRISSKTANGQGKRLTPRWCCFQSITQF